MAAIETLVRVLNRRGLRILHVVDAVTVYASLLAVTGALILLRPGFNALAHLPRYAWSYVLITLVHLVVFDFGGMYDRERRLGARSSAARIITLVWGASLVVGSISWLLGEYLIPRSVLLVYAFVGPFGLAANRWFSRRLRLRVEGPSRILLVGDDTAVERAGYHVEVAGSYVCVAGHTDSLADLERKVAEVRATDVFLLEGVPLTDLSARSLARLESAGVELLQIVRPHDSMLGLRNVGEIGGIPFVALSSHVLLPSQARSKRWMDIAVLILTLPFTVPLTLLTTAYVAIRVGRPLLFIQDRVGRNGEPFRMFKFRTMVVNAESASTPVQATVNDPRVVGGMELLRQLRLDELPQLFNVLRGEMAVVGPRPERPQELAEFEQEISVYGRRHYAPPGITGLAQVYGRYHTHVEYKLGYDLHYLANWSPILDLQIMLRTAWVIVGRRL